MLGIAEKNLADVPAELNANNLVTAFNEANDAVFYNGLALGLQPNSHSVTGTNDIALGFRQLVTAYHAKSQSNPDLAQSLVDEANSDANDAVTHDSSLQSLADQINQLGTSLMAQ